MDLQDAHGMQLSRKFYPTDDPDVMEEEYNFVKEARDKRNSVVMYKKVLTGSVSVIEYVNKKYDPFAIDLNGWYDSVACSMDEYTPVLEELHEKYKGPSGKVEPEVRLLFMIGSSAVFFHISKELAKNMNPKQYVTAPTQQQPVQQQPQINVAKMFNNMMNPVPVQQPIANNIKPPHLSKEEQQELLDAVTRKQFTAPPQKKENEEDILSSFRDADINEIIQKSEKKHSNSTAKKKRPFVVNTEKRK